jgi:hypothetical protein
VADDNRIQQFTTEGEYLSQFGSAGSAPGQFDIAHGIAVDAVGTPLLRTATTTVFRCLSGDSGIDTDPVHCA